jgi:sec-independent protein translocase protein TatC
VVTYLKVAVLAGFFAASPVVFHQTWMFIAPGLYDQERRVVIPLVVASTTLFLGGAAFGYFIIFRYGFEFFLSVIDLETAAVLSINSYLMTATKLLVAFGSCFQLPVVVFFLARTGLIDARDMITGFRYAIVGIFVVAAIITPPDPLTQMLMAGPLVLLYGVGILIAAIFSKKKQRVALEAEAKKNETFPVD